MKTKYVTAEFRADGIGISIIIRLLRSRGLFACFDDFDFFLAQAVQFVNELIDLFVRGFDLALRGGFIVTDFGGGELLVQAEHAFDQCRQRFTKSRSL